MIDVDKKIYIRKPKVHSGEITALAQKENLLITVGKSGQIRVWDLTELENELNELNPYYEISVADGALSIFLYFYQVSKINSLQLMR